MQCRDLIHPFQNDPGVSQSQRIITDLLSGPAKIDGRTMADLLDYFVKLSPHINFYETDGSVKDWTPFFENSPPFIISSITRYNKKSVEETIAVYDEQFIKKPSKAGLRLLIGYINSRILQKVNTWLQKLKQDADLPLNLVMNKLIKDKLSGQLKEFIVLSNTAVKWYGINLPDYNTFLQNEAWDLNTSHVHKVIDTPDFMSWGNTKRKRLITLRSKIAQLLPNFLDVINVMSITAEQSLEQSMFSLSEELKEKNPPHLAIIFSFLKLFTYLQGDLNTYTKKHLDFFYKNVLKLKPQDSVPDKAHIVFEIQKQLDKYLLKKGLLLKDGKDNNKAEILFSTDDEIVVNKSQVGDRKTLFLNNRTIYDKTYVEGVYMAPDAAKANGVDKDFEDEAEASWPTLGAHYSKYSDPENKFMKPYPNARIGFILASPVLLLNEGTRTIDITLSCEFKDICESLLPVISNNDPCCEETAAGSSVIAAGSGSSSYPDFFNPKDLYSKVNTILNQKWFYINRELIAEAVKLGISKDLLEKLNGFLIKAPPEKLCYCPVEEKLYEKTLTDAEFNLTPADRAILKDIFKERKAINAVFSGEKSWIVPDKLEIELQPQPLAGNIFNIIFHCEIEPDQDAVTFYNAENLKEDFGTTMPLVKIELDDKIKLIQDILPGAEKEECCERAVEETRQTVSLYHFFRDVIVKNNNDTKIDVKVCGLKNLIVQNDENVEDTNRLIHPFGVRPKIGANFYIGSGELFLKKWKGIWVNAEWKDRPQDFKKYYEHYTYTQDPFEDGTTEIDNDSFKINIALLENGNWKPDGASDIFTDPKIPWAPHCKHSTPMPQWFEDVYNIHNPGSFANAYEPPPFTSENLSSYNISSRYGFLRFTLDGVSFQHDRYAFVLARHMMALADLVDPISIKLAQDAIKNAKKLIGVIIIRIQEIEDAVGDIEDQISAVNGLKDHLNSLIFLLVDIGVQIVNGNYSNAENQANAAIVIKNQMDTIADDILTIVDNIQDNLVNSVPIILDFDNLTGVGIKILGDELKKIIDQIVDLLKVNDDLKIGLPKEPYTPTLKSINIDYTASAPIFDIKLIHLYPYTGTYKNEELESEPALLPTYCDEGNLFIGLKDLVPGSNLHMLFQLAEATADSESEQEFVKWFYLENNQWKLLRYGFEVIDDATEGLTTSGIVKFALPGNMTNENTILPKGMHWLKAAIPKNSRSVCETIGIYTQAIRVTFTNDEANDKLRLSEPLQAGKISKLYEADANVKKALQPYDSFGGREPEGGGYFYVRVSELLHHKGRAIQKFDYERLALDAFPQLFKVKCINHSFALDAHKYYNDFPVAPGYVLLAVIPDLNKLKAAKQFEPRVPASLLEDIQDYFHMRTSPFVRLWVKNPRYEKVNFCLKVKLHQGKDESYYKEKLKQDLREFLAPWAIGEYDKITFGQCIVRSDIVQFLESRDYVDYILELKMQHEDDINAPGGEPKVCPGTPRSILIAGNIDVCIKQQECESWCKEGSPCENEPEPIIDYCKEEEAIG